MPSPAPTYTAEQVAAAGPDVSRMFSDLASLAPPIVLSPTDGYDSLDEVMQVRDAGKPQHHPLLVEPTNALTPPIKHIISTAIKAAPIMKGQSSGSIEKVIIAEIQALVSNPDVLHTDSLQPVYKHILSDEGKTRLFAEELVSTLEQSSNLDTKKHEGGFFPEYTKSSVRKAAPELAIVKTMLAKMADERAKSLVTQAHSPAQGLAIPISLKETQALQDAATHLLIKHGWATIAPESFDSSLFTEALRAVIGEEKSAQKAMTVESISAAFEAKLHVPANKQQLHDLINTDPRQVMHLGSRENADCKLWVQNPEEAARQAAETTAKSAEFRDFLAGRRPTHEPSTGWLARLQAQEPPVQTGSQKMQLPRDLSFTERLAKRQNTGTEQVFGRGAG